MQLDTKTLLLVVSIGCNGYLIPEVIHLNKNIDQYKNAHEEIMKLSSEIEETQNKIDSLRITWEVEKKYKNITFKDSK